MNNPYENNALAAPKNYGVTHTDYSTPEEAAEIALATKQSWDTRHDYARKIFQDHGNDIKNKTAQKLIQIVERRFDAHANLSLLGYTNLRHLQAEGLTLAEIARDLGMNLLDIMAYMSANPNAYNDATVDALACADAKIRDFLDKLEHEPPRTKFEADRKNIQYKVLLEQVKRISSQWAQFAQAPKEEGHKGSFALNISLHSPEAIKQVQATAEVSGTVIDVEPEHTYYTQPAPVDSSGVYQDPLAEPKKIKATNHDFDRRESRVLEE